MYVKNLREGTMECGYQAHSTQNLILHSNHSQTFAPLCVCIKKKKKKEQQNNRRREKGEGRRKKEEGRRKESIENKVAEIQNVSGQGGRRQIIEASRRVQKETSNYHARVNPPCVELRQDRQHELNQTHI